MLRPLLLRSPTYPYHVYARANNQEWFYLPIESVWEIFRQLWNEAALATGVHIHAFVLMSNHFHAIVSTPNKNLDEVMHLVLREAARRINTQAGRINHVFGGPYKWSIIENRLHYKHVIRYVYQNPVKAKICARVEEYPFTTLSDWMQAGERKAFPISDSIFERESVMDLAISQKIEWLNQTYSPVEYETFRMALRRARFKTRRSHMPREAWVRLHS